MEWSKIFFSYCHKDNLWRQRLLDHLKILEHEGLVHLWADTRIEIGRDWQDQINKAMDESQAARLLLSPNFLASEYILGKELPSIMQAHARNGMRLLPVIARPCAWKLVNWLRATQARPRDDRALSAGHEYQVDVDLTALAYEVAAIIGRADPVAVADEVSPSLQQSAQLARASVVSVAAPPPSQLTSPLMMKREVKAIQIALKKKGFDPGPADSEFGSRTKKAVVEFQKANELVADGKVGPQTASALGVSLD